MATDAVGATFGEVDVVLALEEGAGVAVEGDADFASCTEVLQEEGEELVEAVGGGLQVVLEEDVDGVLYGVPLASDDGAWLGALVFGVHLEVAFEQRLVVGRGGGVEGVGIGLVVVEVEA